MSAPLLFVSVFGAWRTSCGREESNTLGNAEGVTPAVPVVKSLEVIGEGAFPKWSPDGKTVAFTREEKDPGDPLGITYEVYTSRPDGSEARCLTSGKDALSGTRWKGQPYWHPRRVPGFHRREGEISSEGDGSRGSARDRP